MQSDPSANPRNEYPIGKARFTWLTPAILRMEWSPTKSFEDRASLAVVHRNCSEVAVTQKEKNGWQCMSTDYMDVCYKDDGAPFHSDNLEIHFRRSGIQGKWTPGTPSKGNLKGTTRTLDGTRGNKKLKFLTAQKTKETEEIELGDGLLSRDGWALHDDSHNPLLDPSAEAPFPWASPRPNDDALDWYFICCGHDYKASLKETSQIFGTQPLPPRYAFGYWYSRYWAYTDWEILSLADQFHTMNIPIDVMVIDMDWHLPGWTGYTWDHRYFPAPEETLKSLHKKGLKTTLNLHPAEGVGPHEKAYPDVCKKLGKDPDKRKTIPFDCTDPEYMKAYFECLHHPIEEQGLDFWWMDWQQGKKTKIPGLDPLPWLNYTHWMDQAKNPERQQRRPMNFSRYGGLGSGRYPVGFSGDTTSCWEGLAYQLWFTPTASNVLYGYWSHDIGGHMGGEFDPELYMRWLQFGLYSPILRTHTTKTVSDASERRFWAFPEPYREIMMETVRERYRMVPYLYSESRSAYDEGLSLCRPLYYEHPEEEQAYQASQQYYFGSQLIAAPIAKPADKNTRLCEHHFWLPEGKWIERSTGKSYEGGQWQNDSFALNDTPTFARPGTIIPKQGLVLNLDAPSYPCLQLEITTGGSGNYTLYEDDGKTENYRNGASAQTQFEYNEDHEHGTLILHPTSGSYPGQRSVRPVVILLNGVCPNTIKRNYSNSPIPYHYSDSTWSAGTWYYDALHDRTIIYLNELNHLEKEVLTFHWDAQSVCHTINGLAGLFQRLETVRQLACQCSPPHPMHPDERLPVELAQTANRMTRDPSNRQQEMKNLMENLPKLPEVLKKLREAFANKKDPHKSEQQTLKKAQKLAKATLKQYL